MFYLITLKDIRNNLQTLAREGLMQKGALKKSAFSTKLMGGEAFSLVVIFFIAERGKAGSRICKKEGPRSKRGGRVADITRK